MNVRSWNARALNPRALNLRVATLAGVLSAVAWVVWPRSWRVAAGVVGGALLMGGAAWAIRGLVDGVIGRGPTEAGKATLLPGLLVKFFTRHAILALAAYGMMARFGLDPIGMLVGVSTLPVALGVEACRRRKGID